MRSVSIRAVPKISLMCQENPDNDFGRAEEIRSKQAQYCGELWAMRIVSSTGLSRRGGTPTLPVDSPCFWQEAPRKSAHVCSPPPRW